MSEASIITDGLVRRFGKVEALRGLNLKIAPGSITGLIGNNGAGKTTAIHILLGFIPPNAGTAKVLGLNPSQQPIEIRKRVGFFPEHDRPYDWMRVRTLWDLGAAAYPQWDRTLCKALCQQFDIDVNRRIAQLSKGMVAKTKLIFAFAHHPECLILDEPTGGLDPSSRHDLRTMVRELAQQHGVTALFSTHNLDDVVGIATDVAIIHEGRILLSMDMDTIRSQLGLFEFHHGEENIPSALDGQIIKKVQKSNTSSWLVRDRNNPSFVNFAQKHMTDGQAVQEVSLQTLFLFLTSGQVTPQQENIPGP